MGDATLIIKFKDARLRARSGEYLLGLVQAFEVENPYAIIVAIVLSEELRVRALVSADDLSQELQNWLEGSEVYNPAWIGALPRTNAAMDSYVKFGKPPSQEDLVKWILSRCELDIGAEPGLFFGSRKRPQAKDTGKSDSNVIRTKEGGALVDNPYSQTVHAAQLKGGPVTASLPTMTQRTLTATSRTGREKAMASFRKTQKILGKSTALEKLRAEPEAESEKLDWTGEHYLLGAYIERGRKKVETAMDTRRREIKIAKTRKKQSVQRYINVREQIEGSAGAAAWLKDAEEELKKLQKIERDVEDDLRRQRGKAHREKQRMIWELAPLGDAKLRGKSVPGPKLGDGPLPTSVTNSLRDPRRDNAEAKYYWDTQGRKHEKDPEMVMASTEDDDNLINYAMDAIRKAATSAAMYKLDMKSVFSAMDTSGDGFLNEDELISALATLGARLEPEAAAAVMKHFDPDGSGLIHYGEFMWAFFNRRSLVRRWVRNTQGMTEQQMRAIFHACDKNNDGKLGSKEFKKMLESLNVSLSDSDRELVMTQFDQDGDGKLDLNEFRDFIRSEQDELKKTAEAAQVKAKTLPQPKSIPRPKTAPGGGQGVLSKTIPASASAKDEDPINTRASFDGVLSVMGTQVGKKMSSREDIAEAKADSLNLMEAYDNLVGESASKGDGVTWVVNALKAQQSIESKLGSKYYS